MNEMYTVTLSKAQLQLVQTACEDYLRTRMGQFWDLTQDIVAADSFVDDGRIRTTVSSEMRLAAEEVMRCAYNLLQGPIRKKTDEMLIAEELFTQIRHDLYMESPVEGRTYLCVASDEPLKLTEEPRIKIERKKD